jgi:hypothetical protein
LSARTWDVHASVVVGERLNLPTTLPLQAVGIKTSSLIDPALKAL